MFSKFVLLLQLRKQNFSVIANVIAIANAYFIVCCCTFTSSLLVCFYINYLYA